MSIRWITPKLGTAPALHVSFDDDINIIDVRDYLVDKVGNKVETVREKIFDGYNSLHDGKRTVVCCDYGISRSNAIAAGILAMYNNIAFEAAIKQVMEVTGESEIKIALLDVVSQALNLGKKLSSFSKRGVLITGANGAIGNPLSQELAKEFDILTPTRTELDLQLGSTQLDLLVRENQIDCIVHLANPRIYSSNIALGNTMIMLRNVLDVCAIHNIRLIYLSSWEVYSGYRSSNLIADENLPLMPKGLFGETKYLAETLIEYFRKMHDLRCTVLRISPTYGIHMNKPNFIFNFLNKIKNNETISTHIYRNGLPALDLIYIDDIVSAIIKAINIDFNENINIGTGVTTSIRKIAELLQEMLGSHKPINSTPIVSDTAVISMDTTKASRILDWNATVSIESGLRKILKNHENI